MNLFRFL